MLLRVWWCFWESGGREGVVAKSDLKGCNVYIYSIQAFSVIKKPVTGSSAVLPWCVAFWGGAGVVNNEEVDGIIMYMLLEVVYRSLWVVCALLKSHLSPRKSANPKWFTMLIYSNPGPLHWTVWMSVLLQQHQLTNYFFSFETIQQQPLFAAVVPCVVRIVLLIICMCMC